MVYLSDNTLSPGVVGAALFIMHTTSLATFSTISLTTSSIFSLCFAGTIFYFEFSPLRASKTSSTY